MSVIAFALLFLVVTNVVAFSLFGVDKNRARTRGHRIPERVLLRASMVGGLGAWLGQHLFRHKTRKEPFRTHMRLVVLLHIIIAGTCLCWLALDA